MRILRKHWLVLAALLTVAMAASIAPACDEASCKDPSCSKPSGDAPQYERRPWMQTSVIGGGSPQSQPSGWKVFPDKFANVVQDVREHGRDRRDMYWYFGNIAITTLLYAGIVVLVRRGVVSSAVRKLYQITFLVLWVFLIAQCLCAVKEFAVLVMYSLHDLDVLAFLHAVPQPGESGAEPVRIGFTGIDAKEYRLLFGLCTAWMGVAVVLMTLALRGKARSPFCFWICPLGTVQDLAETGIHKHLPSAVRIAVLFVLAVVLVGVLMYNPPVKLNDYGGPALALLTVLLSMLAISSPQLDRLFCKFVYVSMVGWFALCIWGMWGEIGNWTSGPWCVLGVGNYKNPLVLTFIIVMATSLVAPRAWCNYVCPNRGLFEWLGGPKGRHGGRGGTA